MCDALFAERVCRVCWSRQDQEEVVLHGQAVRLVCGYDGAEDVGRA